jgi:hypothetical protein
VLIRPRVDTGRRFCAAHSRTTAGSGWCPGRRPLLDFRLVMPWRERPRDVPARRATSRYGFSGCSVPFREVDFQMLTLEAERDGRGLANAVKVVRNNNSLCHTIKPAVRARICQHKGGNDVYWESVSLYLYGELSTCRLAYHVDSAISLMPCADRSD